MLEEITPTHIRHSDQTRLSPTGDKAHRHEGIQLVTWSKRPGFENQKQTNHSDVSLTLTPDDSGFEERSSMKSVKLLITTNASVRYQTHT